MNTWRCDFNKKAREISSIDDIDNHENLIGFVYKITNLKNGKIYIGKKNFYHSRKARISKKEKSETKTRKTFKYMIKESDWLKYYGSCKELKDDLKKIGEEYFKREILELCCTKKYLSYCELKYQIQYDVLKQNSYNGNILGRYYPKDIENCK